MDSWSAAADIAVLVARHCQGQVLDTGGIKRGMVAPHVRCWTRSKSRHTGRVWSSQFWILGQMRLFSFKGDCCVPYVYTCSDLGITTFPSSTFFLPCFFFTDSAGGVMGVGGRRGKPGSALVGIRGGVSREHPPQSALYIWNYRNSSQAPGSPHLSGFPSSASLKSLSIRGDVCMSGSSHNTWLLQNSTGWTLC